MTLSQRVLHPKFGEGIVLNFEGVGQQSRGQIQFDDVGAKGRCEQVARTFITNSLSAFEMIITP
ncbi:hypothetical protein ACET98_18670, partial [Aeromonas veronii]